MPAPPALQAPTTGTVQVYFSDTYALGEQFAVVGGVTEQQLRALGPLEVEVGRMLPGETNTPVDLDVLCSRVEVGL